MLLPNNPQIDTNTVNEAVALVAAHRRRRTPIFKAPKMQSMVQLTVKPYAGPLLKIRAFVARLPVVGPLLLAAYRRMYPVFAPATHWKQRIRLIPVIGSVGAWAFALVRLEQTSNTVVHLKMRLESLEALNLAQRLQQFDAMDIATRLNQVESLNLAQRLQQFDAIDIAARLNRLDAYQNDASKTSLKLENQVAALTRVLRRNTEASPRVTPPIQDPAPGQPSQDTDDFYVDLEDTFRGSREDISQRLKVYLPYFDKFTADPLAHVVDVGCGRGEWLELMHQHGIKATGIDLNAAMVDACQKLGLQALCMDAVHYLRQQPEGSLAAVTGFHIIEHLPFDTLLALFDAALKALRPDGLIVFETPNPENILVGACNFHHDPTHLKPIIPAVAAFMAGQRGFAHSQILRLHPYPQDHLIPEDGLLAKRFNALFYGPQDYALLAWKTHD